MLDIIKLKENFEERVKLLQIGLNNNYETLLEFQ